MPWFRLDDQGAFHAKVVMAGNEAYGAWCRAGQWCSDHLTDGRIPIDIAHAIGPKRLWTRLIEAVPPGHTVGLLEAIEGGYQIHDYLDINPSREQVLAEREKRSAAKAEAGRKGGIRSGESRRSRSKSEADAKQTRSNDEASAEATSKQNEAPYPYQDLASAKQDTHTLRAGAHEASPEAPPAPERIVEPNPEFPGRRIAAELRRFPLLVVDIDVPKLAETVFSRMVARGARLEDVLGAIGEAAADSQPGETAETRWKRFRSYTDHAKQRRQAAGDGAGGGGGKRDPRGRPLQSGADPNEWQDMAALRGARS